MIIAILLATVITTLTDEIIVSFINSKTQESGQFELPPQYQVKNVVVKSKKVLATEFVASTEKPIRGRWIMDWHFLSNNSDKESIIVAVFGSARITYPGGQTLTDGVYFVSQTKETRRLKYVLEGASLKVTLPNKLLDDHEMWIACSRYAPDSIGRDILPALDEVTRVVFTAERFKDRSIMIPSVPDF